MPDLNEPVRIIDNLGKAQVSFYSASRFHYSLQQVHQMYSIQSFNDEYIVNRAQQMLNIALYGVDQG